MSKTKEVLTQAIIITIVVCVIGFLGYAIVSTISGMIEPQVNELQIPIGSVASGNEYHATSTMDGAGGVITYAARTQVIVATTTPSGETIVTGSDQRFGGITLGSVIIGGVSASDLIIYDATSTTDISSTTAGWIVAAATTGTYTFDVALSRGLILDFAASHDGEYVITWK